MSEAGEFIEPTVTLRIAADPHAHWPPDEAIEAEWLLTNGLGSFAMGTPSGVNTRRYHGLLNAATHPPVGRVNLLNNVLDSVVIAGQEHPLAANEFAMDGSTVFHPHGYRLLHRFEHDTAARWHYRVGMLQIVKELRLIWRRHVGVLRYRVEPAVPHSEASDLPSAVTLRLRPLVSMRDFHQLVTGFDGSRYRVDAQAQGVRIEADGVPALHLLASAGRFDVAPDVWRSFKRRNESYRRQDDLEDLYVPGVFEHTFDRVGEATCEWAVAFGLEPVDAAVFDAPDARRDHLRRAVAHMTRRLPDDHRPELTPVMLSVLAEAADDFVVERFVDGRPLASILAGYPWFADWGRDTMISLPGLLLETGRYEEAKATLAAYARHIRRGLVPNRFDDYGGEPHYNTVDASMWFVHAALECRRVAGDAAFWVDVLAPACQKIIEFYEHGTDDYIHMDADGLITAGDAHTQLTWMDAKRDGVVFTPRHGKCVEINALWYRALVGCAEIDPRYGQLAERVRASFNDTFWEPGLEYLVDHVNPQGVDRSLRPNQVFAVSLPVSPLSVERQRKVMLAVRDRLLTPAGLRTLPQDDPNYHGRYQGSMFERDAAYHRGTVWAWLIGPYVEGWLRAHEFDDAARRHARQAVTPLLERMIRSSMGQLHEVYDGDPPHRGDGCPAQAWSVAAVVRAVMLAECGA